MRVEALPGRWSSRQSQLVVELMARLADRPAAAAD